MSFGTRSEATTSLVHRQSSFFVSCIVSDFCIKIYVTYYRKNPIYNFRREKDNDFSHKEGGGCCLLGGH